MKQVFILIFKSEVNNYNSVDGFFNRKEMYQFEANNLNSDLDDLIWILTPNY